MLSHFFIFGAFLALNFEFGAFISVMGVAGLEFNSLKFNSNVQITIGTNDKTRHDREQGVLFAYSLADSQGICMFAPLERGSRCHCFLVDCDTMQTASIYETVASNVEHLAVRLFVVYGK